MPPRKKPNPSSTSASRKSNPKAQPPPSKFTIQHFFERHSQNSQNPQNPTSSTPPNPKPPVATAIASPKPIQSPTPVEASKTVAASGDPENRLDSQQPSNNNSTNETPSEDVVAVRFMDVEPNVDEEASPEISKSKPIKRFKFSPGMLIKQSQDDGGDEVTWRTSPVNERLKAVSKLKPEMMRVLADTSRLKALSISRCSQNKAPAVKAGQVENSVSLVSLNRVGVKRVKPDQDVEHNGNVADGTVSEIAGSQSPFRTPPSLSYCHDKLTNALSCDGVSDQPGSRQHKKALLELLDQVEDVIGVEESVSNDVVASQFQVNDKSEHVVKRVVTSPIDQVTRASSNYNFLVLEVSVDCGPDDSSGAQCMRKVLRLLNEQSGEECAVYLKEEWFYSVIAPGDTVNVIGEFDVKGKCYVDRHHNFLIVHPDVLVSGTRVAANFICPRRTVLDERLKGNEYSTPALIGTILHQVFEAALMKEKPTVTFLEEHARMGLQRNIENLYACGVHENDVYRTLVDAVPKILNWVNIFKNTQDSEASFVDFGSEYGVKKVTISEVIDIEEMAWAPKYGLKGMIDASVRVKVEANKSESDMKVMPLEFKTGKVPKDQEHSAQVILYTLLMSERYKKPVDTGLLCYLQSDQTQGVAVRRPDLVGLIMQRNQLANDIVKASRMQVLPPMLRNPSFCRSCRHLNVCTIYHKAHGGNTDGSGLGDLFDSVTHQLTNAHGAFLRLWDWLIDLEAKEMELVKKEMWQPHALKSNHSTSCLSSLVLDNELPYLRSGNDNKFVYQFLRTGLSSDNVRTSNGEFQNAASSSSKYADCTLRSGDHVILSSESGHLALARGVISDISHSHVSVSFSKKLRLPGSNCFPEASDLHQEVWRIDKDEFMTSFSTMRFNLLQLFLPSAQSVHLRKMIVDLEAPRFDSGCITFSQDPAISYVWSQRNLNDDQRRAILKILTAKDYALILGMPGTGKTSTMVHAVKALLMRGASILLTSYTNSAVDNLLIKLKAQNIDFVRIGRPEVVHEKVRGHCIAEMNIQSVEDVKSRLDQVKVVAVTCLGITSPLLANKRFDVCIMDEAGQTTLPVSLGPLMFASLFVLVGDHYQLPPLVKSTEARENGMGVSLFCRLSEAHPQAISALQSQYRMCQGIMELSNALIYGDRLRCGSPEIANAKLNFSSWKFHSLWIKEVLNPSKPVIFINTDALPAFEAKDHKIVNNPMEAHIVVEVVEELVNSGIEGNDIGIITPYNSQAEIIRLAINLSSVEVHTIDKYQGRDKDCILVSFVRSTENPRNCSSSLLGDWHRINVALTRAKKKLIMVGSRETLSKVLLMKLLIEKVDEQSGILNVSKKDINFKTELKRCSQVR
ncbi:hypothetical protein ACLB2K_068860 [Fragaria x ananassa]